MSDVPATRGHTGGLVKRSEAGYFYIPQAWSCRAVCDDSPESPQMLTNLDMSTAEGKATYFRTLGEPDHDATDMSGVVFGIKHWVVTRASVLSQASGKLEVIPRVTWINENGLIVAFTSWTIARYQDAIMAIHGIGPIDPPMKVAIKVVFLEGGKRTYGVTPVA